MSHESVKTVALLTAIMSMPLLLSYNVKYQIFPNGIWYLLLYYWALTSVFVVPILITSGLVVLARILMSRTDLGRPALLRINLLGLTIGLIAECVFLIVRKGRP